MTDSFTKKDHTLRWIRVGDLVIHWPEAQRELSERNAKKIADEFDPDMFGTLTVSTLPNGKFHVSDGWTRRSAVQMLFGDNEQVPCVIVPAANAKEAAQIFVTMNGNRTKPSAFVMFKKNVTAGAPAECAIEKVVTGMGLRIATGGNDGTIQAVNALMFIHKQQGDAGLLDTLVVIRSTWGEESAAFDAHLMRGFALFLSQDPASPVDRARLVRRVARKWTPGRICGAGKATREAFGGSQSRAIAALLQETYGTPRATTPTPTKTVTPPVRPVASRRRSEARPEVRPQ
jgi:hypothetical protein